MGTRIRYGFPELRIDGLMRIEREYVGRNEKNPSYILVPGHCKNNRDLQDGLNIHLTILGYSVSSCYPLI